MKKYENNCLQIKEIVVKYNKYIHEGIFNCLMENSTPKYKRILLKLSGEALSGGSRGILNFEMIRSVADVLSKCVNSGVQVAVIVGAGNIWRGAKGVNVDRTRADSMGMLATAINALAIEDVFQRAGLDATAMSAVDVNAFMDRYTPRAAVKALERGKVVILACGSGSPFFSTDTAGALRAAEISADAILMAKNIDGIYSADPKVDPSAVRYEDITYKEVIDKELKALDLTATAFCMDNNIKCYAFGLNDPENIYRVVMGEKIGTEIHK